MEKTPVISIRNLNFAYDGKQVLEEVNLDVYQEDFVGIIGPNGSGKTTLLKLLLGLLRPQSGQISILGESPQKAHSKVGYVPQFANFDPDFPITVRDVVLMGCLNHAPLLGPFRGRDIKHAEDALDRVAVADLRNRQLGTLSGGQRQRVLIARALASSPRLLLLDEPTASIDTVVEEDIYELLHRLNQEAAIVLVSHDLAFVSTHVTRVACLNRTLVCHPTEEISKNLIDNLYGSAVEVVKHRICRGE